MHHQQNISINHVIDKLSRKITTAILDIKEKEKKSNINIQSGIYNLEMYFKQHHNSEIQPIQRKKKIKQTP